MKLLIEYEPCQCQRQDKREDPEVQSIRKIMNKPRRVTHPSVNIEYSQHGSGSTRADIDITFTVLYDKFTENIKFSFDDYLENLISYITNSEEK